MTAEMVSWLLAVPLLGFATGLRTFTPIAVLCWWAVHGEMSVDGTWAAWTAKPAVAILFTVLAVGELLGDKWPRTPNRVSLGPLAARLGLGALCGALSAIALSGPGLEGVVLGVIGALTGAFVGFMVRRELVGWLGCSDWMIALPEDVLAIVIALFAAHVVANT